VEFALTAHYDIPNEKVAVVFLNDPELNIVHDLSSSAVDEILAANVSAVTHLSQDDYDEIQQQNCYWLCVRYETIEGRMDYNCLGICSAPCLYLGGLKRIACTAACRVACWIPGYTICKEVQYVCGGY
jgi:hypothetical protein